LDFLNWQIFIK